MIQHTVDEVADWFLTQGAMSSKKLNKLVYYAYAWFLVLMNAPEDTTEDSPYPNRLFDPQGNDGNNAIQAWVHGPTIPYLWEKYKAHGVLPIPQKEGNDAECFDSDTLDVLQQVWDVYGKYNGNELESIARQESPWQKARQGLEPYEAGTQPISDDNILAYYVPKESDDDD